MRRSIRFFARRMRIDRFLGPPTESAGPENDRRIPRPSRIRYSDHYFHLTLLTVRVIPTREYIRSAFVFTMLQKKKKKKEQRY